MSGFVEGNDRLVHLFGRWPSFHDAEIHEIRLERAAGAGASMTARIHVFEMTNEVDQRGFFVLRHHTMVTMRFENIVLRDLRWFNEENVISMFEVTENRNEDGESRRYAVSISSSYGCEMELLCDRIAILEVEPYTPDTEPSPEPDGAHQGSADVR